MFPEVVARLSHYFDVEANVDDVDWSAAELAARLRGKDGALTTASVRIDAPLLSACPGLRICANMAVGYDNFDVQAMTRHGVLATNTPDVLTETTADFGFALLMAAARRITEGENYLRGGHWKRWRYDMFAGAEVHGTTLGILGMGRIGQSIARRGALGFGMKVIYHNRHPVPSIEAELGARFATKEVLLNSADHVVVVLPFSPETRHAIGASELALMKSTATLVNVARGGIVDDVALAVALQEGRIAAAGLDVFEGEPAVHPGLLACRNVVLTPHIGSGTIRTRRAMADAAADNLIGYLAGNGAVSPVNNLP